MVPTESELTIQFQNQLKKLSVYLAAALCIIGVLVLAGWQFDIEFLKRIIPGLVAMNPVTAICFIFSGSSLIIIYKYGNINHTIHVFHIHNLFVLIIRASCQVMNLKGIENGIDHFLFSEKLNDEISNIRNRMAPNTAFNFIICSIYIFILNSKNNMYKTANYIIFITFF